MGDGEHGGCDEPRQAHDRAHAQHHPHNKQVQVVATAFLEIEKRMADLDYFMNTFGACGCFCLLR